MKNLALRKFHLLVQRVVDQIINFFAKMLAVSTR